MKGKETNNVKSRRNGFIKNCDSINDEDNSKPNQMNNNNNNNSISNVKRKNIILKHEILSPECDLFKASIPRRLRFILLFKILIITIFGVLGTFYVRRRDFNGNEEDIGIGIGMALCTVIVFSCSTSIIAMLLQIIEGKITIILLKIIILPYYTRKDIIYKRIRYSI
jgi:hypothetical protein